MARYRKPVIIFKMKSTPLLQCVHQIREQISDTYDPPELVGLEEQISFFTETLTSTAIHGDNSSLLLVGQRSTGKTAVWIVFFSSSQS